MEKKLQIKVQKIDEHANTIELLGDISSINPAIRDFLLSLCPLPKQEMFAKAEIKLSVELEWIPVLVN